MGKKETTRLLITKNEVVGEKFWWDEPPNLDLVKKALEEQSKLDIGDEFSWRWNLGRNGMPVVVQIVGDHTQECRFWLGEDGHEDVELSHRQDFSDVVRAVGIHGKINLRDKREIKTEIVKFPKVVEINQGGNQFEIEIAGVNSCMVIMAR